MAWSPLSSRLSSLPLLLAGPIVRRTEASNVSVWFVLKENRSVTLNVFSSKTGGSALVTGRQTSGISIGNNVFVYCVTATGATFSAGTNYYYDIDFSGTTLSRLISDGLNLTYDGGDRPSFALPPSDLNNVRLIHGSCRKPHGEGYDALEGVDGMLSDAVSGGTINATSRPHQLYLTGDQIYADDVADTMLYMINDAAGTLMGWDENYSPFTADELLPGKRNTNDRLENSIGFTGMLPNKPQYSKSHLLKFREYALMYMFAWSDVLWVAESDIPEYDTVHSGPDAYIEEDDMYETTTRQRYDYFDSERGYVQKYRTTIFKVRKALANISTYMIFDDHEITDDWNMNWNWCKRVYSKPLGKRTVQNGLLAYALFQAWGNTPDQFMQPAKAPLLTAANAWRGAEDSHFATMKSLLNVPDINSSAPIADFPQNSTVFDWHFTIAYPAFNLIVLDSRTQRHFPRGSDINFAGLISSSGFSRQLPSGSISYKKVSTVVCPAPVLGMPLVEWLQEFTTGGSSNIFSRIYDLFQSTTRARYDLDAEAWGLHKESMQRLFAVLARSINVSTIPNPTETGGGIRFLLLSGDVHYGFSAKHQIWGPHLFENSGTQDQNVIFAQLTASSCKNETSSTMQLHEMGYIPGDSTPQIEEYCWNNPSGGSLLVGMEDRGLPGGATYPYSETGNPIIFDLDDIRDRNLVRIEPAHWRSRTRFLLAESTGRPGTPARVDFPPPTEDRREAIGHYLALSSNHSSYVGTWGNGKEIVGANNIGEISFQNADTPTMSVIHTIFWRLNPHGSAGPLPLAPLSRFNISLNFNDSLTPFPNFPF